jgi:uncharacterized protein
MSERPGPRIDCPACGKKGDWFAGKFGPFCSYRCRLVDMGKWLGGEHVISEPLKVEHLQEAENHDSDKPNGD